MSFSDVLRAQGLQPGIGDLRVTVGPCSREVSAALQSPSCRAGGPRGTRTHRKRPARQFQFSYLPAEDVPGLSAELLQASGSLYLLLKTRYEIHIAKAQDEMWARRASRREARLLGIGPGDPVLILRRVCVLSGSRPIEYALSVIRSDIYRYVVRLTPPRLASQGVIGS